MVESDTPAIRALAGSGLEFTVVRTERPSSVEESAALQGIDVGSLLRSIVVGKGADHYVVVLVPGGRQIDWPKLRAALGVSRLSLPDQEEALAATGYERGAITPFGSRHPWPVVADASIEGLDRVAGSPPEPRRRWPPVRPRPARPSGGARGRRDPNRSLTRLVCPIRRAAIGSKTPTKRRFQWHIPTRISRVRRPKPSPRGT